MDTSYWNSTCALSVVSDSRGFQKGLYHEMKAQVQEKLRLFAEETHKWFPKGTKRNWETPRGTTIPRSEMTIEECLASFLHHVCTEAFCFPKVLRTPDFLRNSSQDFPTFFPEIPQNQASLRRSEMTRFSKKSKN